MTMTGGKCTRGDQVEFAAAVSFRAAARGTRGGVGIPVMKKKTLPYYKLKKKYGVKHRDALAYKMSFFLGVMALSLVGVSLGIIKRSDAPAPTGALTSRVPSFFRGGPDDVDVHPGASSRTRRALVDDNATEECKTGLSTLNVTLSPDYPPDIFSNEQRQQGAIALHFLFVAFCFIGLAIVCDDYFEASLEAICEALGLKEDVAGATFMAAGGSAPELFTSIMGVFVSKSDVGFGTIIGSAVFNVLFVIAVCAYVCPNLALTWWPLARDSVFYLFAIVVLTCCVEDQKVYWHEAFILLCCYALYVMIMYFNERLEKWVTAAVEREKKRGNACTRCFKAVTDHFLFESLVYIVILANVVAVFAETPDATQATVDVIFIINLTCSVFFIVELVMRLVANGLFSHWRDPLNVFDGILVALIVLEWVLSLMSTGTIDAGASSGVARIMRVLRFFRAWRVLRLVALMRKANVVLLDRGTQTEEGDDKNVRGYMTKEPSRRSLAGASGSNLTQVKPVDASGSAFAKEPGEKSESTGDSEPTEGGDGDDDDEGPPNPFEVPESACGKFWWAFGFPLHILMWLTIPHPGGRCGTKIWPVTFIMCIAWITALSYAMVWMAVLIGFTLSIPDAIMGLTLLAGGTSIPDALSSLAVAKRGFGDMAVSSSIGSNVFDILIGLPVPWIIACWMGMNGGAVEIYSENLLIMILTLFIMVAIVIMTISWAGTFSLSKCCFSVSLFLFSLFLVSLSLALSLSPSLSPICLSLSLSHLPLSLSLSW
jgi:K+-dependent Na+/Ca+ exchanger-like protein